MLVAILILFEITNHPVCAAEERDLFMEALPPEGSFIHSFGTTGEKPGDFL